MPCSPHSTQRLLAGRRAGCAALHLPRPLPPVAVVTACIHSASPHLHPPLSHPRRHGPGHQHHGHAGDRQAGGVQPGECVWEGGGVFVCVCAVGSAFCSPPAEVPTPFRLDPTRPRPATSPPPAGARQRRAAAPRLRLCGGQLSGGQQQGRVGHQALQPARGGVPAGQRRAGAGAGGEQGGSSCSGARACARGCAEGSSAPL